MKKISMFALSLLLMSCQSSSIKNDSNPKKNDLSINESTKNTKTVDIENSDSSGSIVELRQYESCFFEAQQLLAINKEKYNNQVIELYNMVRVAKYYAGIEKKINSNIALSISPLYEFKVNDACNSVSQALLAELRKGDNIKLVIKK